MRIFVDTNVVLDVLAARVPFLEDASAIWELAERKSLEAFVSSVSVTNVYYLIKKFQSRDTALDCVRRMRGVLSMAACESATIDRALQLDLKDFEDGIQLASAEAIAAACVITRNPRDFPANSIPVLTPSEFLAQTEVAKLLP